MNKRKPSLLRPTGWEQLIDRHVLATPPDRLAMASEHLVVACKPRNVTAREVLARIDAALASLALSTLDRSDLLLQLTQSYSPASIRLVAAMIRERLDVGNSK